MAELNIMDPHRAERVSEAIREELEELIGYEMTDPRVSGITVTEVILSPDLKRADVRLAMPPDEEARKKALNALDHARNFLKRELALRLQLFRVPDLHFAEDLSANLSERVEHLLKRVKKGRPRD
jgi:ribosome-binding factor A